jgi:hypothetical protein
VDLPPLQLEMVRFGLQGQPAHQVCRPVEAGASLTTAISGSAPCRRDVSRIRIDEPPGWPVLPPPPLPRDAAIPPAAAATSSGRSTPAAAAPARP